LLRAASSIARASSWRLRPPALAGSRARALCAPAAERITITFVEAGEDVVVEAQVGKSILEVAQENEIDLEGACDGSMACSTCHVVFEQKHY
jgi:Na+-transporting NADH:ubiquinone oxidoreductase subunit NqrF